MTIEFIFKNIGDIFLLLPSDAIGFTLNIRFERLQRQNKLKIATYITTIYIFLSNIKMRCSRAQVFKLIIQMLCGVPVGWKLVIFTK